MSMAKKKCPRRRNSPVALQRTTEEIEDASQQLADEVSREATDEALHETISQVPSQEALQETTSQVPSQEAIEEATEEAPQEVIDLHPKDVHSSPYLTSPVSLYVGPRQVCYTVLRGFLSESAQWSRTSYCLELPEVSEEAGHTLVHYLYTGTYQTPQSQDNDDKITELRRNVCLYCTAIKYGLAGLATLAREKIQNIKGDVAVFDTLGIIKEAYQTMLGDDAGLTPYMKGEIKTAFEIDSGLFEKDTFVELFGEAKQFDRILMRIVAELFAEKMAAIYEHTQLTINGSANAAIAPENSTRLSQHEALREELEAVIIEESAVEYAECDVPTEAPEEYTMEYAVEYAECEGPTEAPEEYAVEYAVESAECEVPTVAPEGYTVGYAVESAECEVPTEAPEEYAVEYAVEPAECEVPTVGYAVESAECEVPTVAPEEYTVEHAVDYAECEVPTEAPEEYTVEYAECEVLTEVPEEYTLEYAVEYAECVISTEAPQKYTVGYAVYEAAADAMCEDPPECGRRAPFSGNDYGDSWEVAAPSKEPTSAPVEEPTSFFCEETVVAEEPTSVSCEKTASAEEPVSIFCEETASAEESTSVLCEETASAEEPTSVADTEPISIHSKEPTSIAIAELTAVPDEKPAPLTKVSRERMKLRNGKVIALPENEQSQTGVDRKKGKKVKKTSKVASYEPEVKIPRKKAKKANKEKSSEISGSGEPDSGPRRVPEPVHETIAEPSPLWIIPKPSKHATQESSVCASQAEHLLNGDMWKNCNKCRALIRRLSTELAQTMTAAEEGFEVIEATNWEFNGFEIGT